MTEDVFWFWAAREIRWTSGDLDCSEGSERWLRPAEHVREDDDEGLELEIDWKLARREVAFGWGIRTILIREVCWIADE